MQSLIVLAGLALFALSVLLFRRREGVPVSVWKRGNGYSRVGLLLWWLSLACIGTGLVMIVRAD